MSDTHLHHLIEDTLRYSEKDEDELSIEEYRSLRRALHTDVLDVIAAERSFFVLGSYNSEERSRLDETVEFLYNDGHAFLLDDSLEARENWTTHFKIYADRATHIVGVFEHAEFWVERATVGYGNSLDDFEILGPGADSCETALH